jgi:hypothetical protein
MVSKEWNDNAANQMTFGRKGRVVTPGNVDLDPIAKAIVMLADGDITIVPAGNQNSETISFTGLAAGQVVPFVVRRVTACSSLCAAIDA